MASLIVDIRLIFFLTTSQGIHWITTELRYLLLYSRIDPTVCLAAAFKLQEVAAESRIRCIRCQLHCDCLHVCCSWSFLQIIHGQLDDHSKLDLFLH